MVTNEDEILEREAEMAATSACVRDVRRFGQVLIIEGPAGIGKTTILRWATRHAPDDVRVAAARGTELESELAFATLLALLSPSVENAGPGIFRGAAAATQPLFLKASPTPIDELGVLHGLHWLCANLAESRPLVLVVDDLQWVDRESLRFLRYLGERIDELPIAILATVRTGEDRSRAAEISDLASGPFASTLRPAPLSLAAITQIAGHALGPDLDEDLPKECWKTSGGNPLFATELLRSRSTNARTTTPEAVVRLVEGRIARLPKSAGNLALALAVLGDETNPREAATVAGLPLDETLSTLDLLAETELTETDNLVAFRHPVVRDAAIGAMRPGERTRLHLAAARMLHVSHPARAAAQLAAIEPACPSGEPWAASLLHDAAITALKRGGNNEAIRHLTRALDEPAEPELRRQILLNLGRLEAHARDPAALTHLEDAAALATNPVEGARIALAQGDALFYFGLLEQCSTVCLNAVSDLDGQDRELALTLEATALNADALLGARRERPAELEPQVATAVTSGERSVLVHVLADLAATGRSDAAAVRHLGQRALGEGKLLDEVGPTSPIYIYAGTALAWADDFEAVLQLTESGLALARARGSRMGIAYSLALNSGVRLRAGDIGGCESNAALVVEELAEADPMAYAISVAWLIEALLEQGAPEAARQALDSSGLDGKLPALGTVAFLMLARGSLLLAEHDVKGALEEFSAVGELADRSRYTNPAALAWRSRRALALVEAGRDTEALEQAEEELAIARAFGAGRAIAVALSACAQATPVIEDRIPLLTEAITESKRSRAHLEHARGLVHLGVAQFETSDLRARETLEAGMDRAHRCGAKAVVDQAIATLRLTGARPRRPAVVGIEALTRQERTVAGMAVEGKGNREIAEALFVTRRTVETHLSNVYRKLSITSREKLPEALNASPAE